MVGESRRCFGDGCGMMDARTMDVLSGFLVAGLAKVNAFITLGDGFEEDGGSDFYSVCAGVRRESALTGCASHLPMGGFGSHLVFR